MNRITSTAALTLTAALALGACSGPNGESETSTTTSTANDADVMFAQMMIPHHEQAIEMSELVLENGSGDAEVTSLAEDIMAAQGPEIEQLDTWLEDWGAEPMADEMAGMDHGDGMMSEEDMAALDSASGTEADELFLEQMIVHHEGAVQMAQGEVEDGENADAIALAEQIIEAQNIEITLMQDLLDR
ncbi:DUF305 domain-containing protein [Ruania alba]|uniref:Uncharacterized conserved protein, DUF305 family n=1 Tax=Ruania alba TaxID=648782 RepID=A0A1H5H8F1_9MICO|nr:DUF305 domain-containing protein [Ruania alba]SEE24247.1 Uncharacterized conserved protein, DUF305 family [Ruania alba]